MLIRPHDLLFLTGKASLRDSLAPLIDGFWQPASMPVVVRRDVHNADWIPIGLRGPNRQDRQANWAKKGDVLRVLTPEDLASSSILENSPLRDWPAVQAALKILLRPAPAKWGIDVQISTPSGGFALREWLLRDAVLLKTNSGPVLTDKPWGDLS